MHALYEVAIVPVIRRSLAATRSNVASTGYGQPGLASQNAAGLSHSFLLYSRSLKFRRALMPLMQPLKPTASCMTPLAAAPRSDRRRNPISASAGDTSLKCRCGVRTWTWQSDGGDASVVGGMTLDTDHRRRGATRCSDHEVDRVTPRPRYERFNGSSSVK